MKITPVTGPGAIQDLSTPEPVREARMKAAFEKATQPADQGSPDRLPVNPNSISAEELSAVKPIPKARLQSQTEETVELSDNSAELSTEETETEVKDPEVQRRFAQIARQEKALRAKAHQQNLALKQREDALKAREAALEPKAIAPDYSNYVDKNRIKQDALGVLEEAGISWDDLTNQAINRAPTDIRVTNTIARLEQKIAQLEEANQNSAKTYQEQQQAQYQAAVKQIKADAKQLVYTDPEFETIKSMNAVKDVVDLIEQTYAKDGIVLSVEEAAKEVENYLVEEAMKITQIDKIKKRMAAANASRPASETKTQDPKQTQMKTLTNAVGSTRQLTARERALNAFERKG